MESQLDTEKQLHIAGHIIISSARIKRHFPAYNKGLIFGRNLQSIPKNVSIIATLELHYTFPFHIFI